VLSPHGAWVTEPTLANEQVHTTSIKNVISAICRCIHFFYENLTYKT